MIDLTKYDNLVQLDKKYSEIFGENLHYDGMILNKTKRTARQNEVDLKKCHKEYAKALFEIFYNLNPELNEVRTGKILDFRTVYGNDFEKLNEEMEIQLMNTIKIGSIVYTLTTEVKNPKGKVVNVFEPRKNLNFEPPIWRNGEYIDKGRTNGIPRDDHAKMTGDQRVAHFEKWDAMTDEEKIKFMQNYTSPNHLQ